MSCFSTLFFLNIGTEAQASNTTNNTNSTNVTQPTISYIPVLFTSGHIIYISGEVINRTFLPPFHVSVPGVLNCSFVPIETPEADKDRYETRCDYPSNYTSKDQVYVPFPLPLIKKFENITDDEKRLAEAEGQNQFLWIALIAAIITAVAAFVFGRLDEVKEETS